MALGNFGLLPAAASTRTPLLFAGSNRACGSYGGSALGADSFGSEADAYRLFEDGRGKVGHVVLGAAPCELRRRAAA